MPRRAKEVGASPPVHHGKRPDPGAIAGPSAPAHYLVIARVPVAGVELFADYERTVTPLLHEHGGTLKQRLVSVDRTVEAHLIEFVSDERLLDYSADPRRLEADPLLQRSKAEVEVLNVVHMADDWGEPR